MRSDLTVRRGRRGSAPGAWRTRAALCTTAGLVLLAGCHRAEPPPPEPTVASTSSGARAQSAGDASLPGPSDASLAGDGSPRDAATEGDRDAAASASHLDVDAGALPQTRDRPSASGAEHEARVRAFWEGLVADDPDRALDFFFPVAAYAQVKDVANPLGDWRRRLVHNFERDVHALHAGLGQDPELVGLEVPDARARWVEPGEEYNKLGYYRVYGTVLRWTSRGANGTRRAHEAPVSSLISWRGTWYVVHLTGFK